MEPVEFLKLYRHFGGLDFARVADDYVVIVDAQGAIVLSKPLPHTNEAWDEFARAIEPLRPLAIAIETNNGPAVERLLWLNLDIYPVNPMATSRLRDRKSPSGNKSDDLDGLCLADGLRTDGHNWRRLNPEDDMTRHLRLLCRDEQTLIEQQTALVNQLQGTITQYYPTALASFDDWTHPSSWAFILQFASPAILLKKGRRCWENFLHKHRLWRKATAQQKLDTFAAAATAFKPADAVSETQSFLAVCLARQLITLRAQLVQYQERIQALFKSHPAHDLFASLPIPQGKTKPRLLAEIGADPARFATANGLQAYAGTAPVTRASGNSCVHSLRRMCSKPLRFAVHWLATNSLINCPWARIYYDAKRAAGKGHQTALRCLGNRWLKIIWKMIQTNKPYNGELHMRNMIKHGSWLVQLHQQPLTATS
jgi:transposase